jgi:hypothetical protein
MADLSGGTNHSPFFLSLHSSLQSVKIPKAPPNPYVLFYMDQIRGKDITKENLGEHSTAASKVWQGYTIGQKQVCSPFAGERKMTLTCNRFF